ncbi:MAG TPA: glycosyltransferase family 2 protein [Candidatus Limnocylindrales bacterium]|nr:glycosyltransferase family 2 protein [Candidatus Limnocylindrales bacterium]
MISAIIITKNEEKSLKRSLRSLSWCDEVIVIDDDSTDDTVKIAEKLGAKVYKRSLDGDFSAQRNFGLQKAKNDWVLFIDADEEVSPALWFEIMQHTNSPSDKYSGYFIKRQDVIWGRLLKYGETGNKKFLRLAKKNSGKWEGVVHEKWNVVGMTATLNNPLMHYPHVTIENFLHEINLYTDIRAKELYDKKVRTSSFLIIIYPLAKFIQNYFLKQGFRDGVPGLLLALMMSLHSFLVRSKLWFMLQKASK